jgi:hypothetical protein
MTNVAVTAAPQAIVALAAQAAPAAAASIEDISRQTGASIIRRPGAFAYPEPPAEALRIVSRFGRAARAASAVQVRRAREAGLSWHEAGALLGFGELAGHSARTVGEMAADYAAGPRRTNGWFDPCPAFCWECPGCRQATADHGPAASPGRSQQGHADGCERLAADVGEWEQEAPQ